MDKYRQISDLLKGFQQKGQVFFSATVESVDSNTCTVKVDNLSISDVRLTATSETTNDVYLAVPSVGSNVLVGSFSGDLNNLFILKIDSLSEWHCKIDSMAFKLDKNGVEINGGNNGGMIKINELISWMQKIKTDLTTISTAMQSLGVPIVITTDIPVKINFEDTKAKH